MIEILLILAIIILLGVLYLLKEEKEHLKNTKCQLAKAEKQIEDDKPQNPISFYESMKLCNLPIITMKIGVEDINFLVDTGSMENIIDLRVVDLLKLPYRGHTKTFDMYGVTGNTINVPSILMDLEYKGNIYEGHFMVKDLSDSMDMIKEEYGPRIHGVLGAKFFNKYNYVLDFINLIAYTKKR